MRGIKINLRYSIKSTDPPLVVTLKNKNKINK